MLQFCGSVVTSPDCELLIPDRDGVVAGRVLLVMAGQFLLVA
jgi:hypothetical protein